jgi:hypothetical protein
MTKSGRGAAAGSAGTRRRVGGKRSTAGRKTGGRGGTKKGGRRAVKKSGKRKTPEPALRAAVGSDRRATRAVGGALDFGVNPDNRGARRAEGDDRQPRAGTASREAGVGGREGGAGSFSGGDIDIDIVGVGTGGAGVAQTGPDEQDDIGRAD